MQAAEVLENTHVMAMQAVEDLPEAMWDMPGVCGEWSVKDVIVHLTAYELLQVDVLRTLQGEHPTPYMLRMAQSIEDFNQTVDEAHKYQPAQQVLNDYHDAQVQTTSLLSQIPDEKLEEKGTMPWYKNKDGMSVADLIKFLARHTQFHCEQIIQYREKNKAAG